MAGNLSEKQEKLLVLFKKAMHGEQEAQRIYSEMLSNCDDPSIKIIIETLLNQEIKHEELLLEKYKNLRKTENFKD
jgi:rubrerythrin